MCPDQWPNREHAGQLQKTAYLFTQSVLGEFGQTAIIGFDSRIKVLSEFTNDPKKIDRVLTNLRTGPNGIRVSDAVYEGIRLLLKRPQTHKRVIVVISEGQDNGSQIRLGETIRTAQLNGIQIYPIYLSTLKARLKDPPAVPNRPYPPGISPLPAAPGSVSTPTTQQQSRNAATPNMIPVIADLVVGVKNLVFKDALGALSSGTGGRNYKPLTDEGLQESIVKIGEDLHSQYLLTYTPNNLNDRGIYHEVEIRVPYSNADVRYRPGYLYGPRPVLDGDPAP
ncbi:MAG: VWA domain-containing protein [Bryobacterales bacterium]